MAEELGEREKDVLVAVVREYITTGAPVGSSQLARNSGFEVSTATLRNVMADLEDLGFLEKPHTSVVGFQTTGRTAFTWTRSFG